MEIQVRVHIILLVDAPYIESIAKYFSAAYMKKLNDIYLAKEVDDKKINTVK
jgi:hypothetical protein